MTRKLTTDQVRSVAHQEAAEVLRRHIEINRRHLFEGAPTAADRDALLDDLHQIANDLSAKAQAIAKLEAAVRLLQQGVAPAEAARQARVKSSTLSMYAARQRAAGVVIPRYTGGPNPKPKLEDLIEVEMKESDGE